MSNKQISLGKALVVKDDGLDTYLKCSKLPSELLAENEELKEALNRSRNYTALARVIDHSKFGQETFEYLDGLLTKYNNQ